jgi:hypothetical protein
MALVVSTCGAACDGTTVDENSHAREARASSVAAEATSAIAPAPSTAPSPSSSSAAVSTASEPVECSSRSGELHATLRNEDLWLSRGNGAPRALVERAKTKVIGDARGVPLSDAGIYGCDFAPDGRSVYFLADKYGTSRGLFAVDLSTTAVRFVDAANGFFVLQECRDPTLVEVLRYTATITSAH